MKNIKLKRWSIFSNVSAMIIIISCFVINLSVVKATSSEDTGNVAPPPHVEVSIDYRGIMANETEGDVLRNQNLLTRISDVLLPGSELYTIDSVKSNDLNGDAPGKELMGDMGCVPVDSNGEPITSLSITLQSYQNVTSEEVAIAMYEDNPFLQSIMTKEEAIAYITGLDNVSSARYGQYSETYQAEIIFTEGGKFIVKIPEDVDEEYFLAIVKIENPETGELIEIDEYYRLFIASGNPEREEDDDSKDEEDDGHRYYSVKNNETNYVDMEPSISASISSQQYDVTSGIPTSENLTYFINTDNALYNITTRATTVVTGVRDITIKLTVSYDQKFSEVEYNESGEQIVKTWTEKKYLTKTVTTDYAYELPKTILYDVTSSNIYPVLNGVLVAQNGENMLSSGSMVFKGSNSISPQFLKVVVQNPQVNDVETGYLGHYSSRSVASDVLERNNGTSVKNRIKAAVHAALSYTGNVNYAYYGLNVTTTSHNGVKPVVAKASAATTKLIQSTSQNGVYSGNGTVLYAGGNIFPAVPNSVKVHTPVVDNSYISSTSEFINQKINKDANRKYLMLDEQFTIYMPNDGTHNDIKGYGTRNYNSWQGVTGLKTTWGKIKDVKLPFDAYLHYTKNGTTHKYFVKANTWLSESGAAGVTALTNNSYTFTIPVWVKEQTYEIQTRVIAENATKTEMYALMEAGKNSLETNYVATNTIPVEVIGKIYDLKVSASNDSGWSSIYSWANKTSYIDATELPFGAEGQNKNIAYKYAPKLGYTFIFDFKTKGTKSNNIDISVQPEGFYFVSRDGSSTQEVDLYYNTTTQKNVKITTSDSKVNLSVKLRDSLLKVAAQELVDSTRIYNSKYNYALSVKIGTLAKLNLPQDVRMCYDNFEEYVNSLYGKGSTKVSISQNAGSTDTVIGSVGHWYAGYKLPASTKAIPLGTDLNTAIANNSFLTDGYILVKFDIKTKYQNASGNYQYLQYMGPEAINDVGENTGILKEDWTRDSMKTITLPNGKSAQVPVGTVAIYDASLRSSNDSESVGTH